MSETAAQEKYDEKSDPIEEVRNFLCGYQLCLDMLNLKKHERKRATIFQDECDCDDLVGEREAYWRARMFEIRSLIESMKNGREKLLLYYHYLRGESIEHAADLLGLSRRTGYRIHKKALLTASFLYVRLKKKQNFE